jgi:hypothetical protein
MHYAIRGAASLALCLSGAALAQQDLSFSSSVDFNYKHLSMAVAVPATSTTNEFKPDLWTINVSPAIAWRGAFLSVGVERTLGEGTTSGPLANGTFWSERSYKRDENTLTLGYNVWAGLSAFAGYFQNGTRFTFNNGAGSTQGKGKYAEYGPYYGLGYSHRFGGGGTVSASYAIARANGVLTQDTFVGSSVQSSRLPGEVTGQSYGIGWSAPLTGSLYYRLGYKATRYDFTFTDPALGERSTKQSYDTLYLGIANYF